jgi:hypothetical protein
MVMTASGYIIDITDAGSSCEAAASPRPPTEAGNLHLILTIS